MNSDGTVGEAIRAATEQLGVPWARDDAEILMAHALGVTRSAMLLGHMRAPEPESFARMLERRLVHEPVAHIIGRAHFYGLDLVVTPDVLIPRGDSETLIEAARDRFIGRRPRRILDLGTGSGALLLAALSLWPEAEGIGVDSSLPALLVAMRNAQAHAHVATGVVGSGHADIPPPPGDRGFVRLIQRDWTEPGWADDLGRFDLVIANPPYVEDGAALDPSVRDHEPAGALFAGPDGLAEYRVLIPQLSTLLAPGGAAVIEIGHRQAAAVTALAHEAGFAATLRRDLAGRPRALTLRLMKPGTKGLAKPR